MTVIETSAAANASPMRILTARAVPFMPTPTDTAKTSSPSESATTTIFASAPAVTGSPLSADRRLLWIAEQVLHRGTQLRQRKRLAQECVGAGGFCARIHRVVVVRADHDDRHLRGRAVLTQL